MVAVCVSPVLFEIYDGGIIVNIANEYKRRFLYFMPEDKGFGNGLVPSGFVSFEVRNGRGKLTAFIENLSDTSQKYEYKLYLISCKEALTTPIYVANIKPVKNKSQINWVFDASDVGGSKLCLEDYDVVAVIAVHKERNSSIISPLVAYMGSKIEWKNKLRDALYIEKIEDNDKYSTTRQEHELASQTKQTGHIEHERQTKQTGKTAKIQQIVVAEQTGQQELAEQSAQIGQTLQADISEQAKQIERTEQTEQTEQTEHTEHTEQTVQTSEASAADETRAKTADSNFDSNSNSQQDTKFCKTCKDTECNKSSANKRNNDKFTSTFDKYLERCNPFNSDRKDYVWWRAW